MFKERKKTVKSRDLFGLEPVSWVIKNCRLRWRWVGHGELQMVLIRSNDM